MGKKKLKEITISSSNLLPIKLEGKWIVSEDEEKAAWEMYVELTTRISVVELKPDEGFLREALTSLYSLFGTTRQILREYGPSVAIPQDESEVAFGYLAVAILNIVLRPVLAKWHPLLYDYECSRKKGTSILEHESKWEKAAELRKVLNETRMTLIDYANLLAKAAGVPSLIVEQ
jgi:hypothetical protein